MTKSEPIQLVLNEDSPRNWESIVRFDNKGFLIATDKHPRMILSFVPFNYKIEYSDEISYKDLVCFIFSLKA